MIFLHEFNFTTAIQALNKFDYHLYVLCGIKFRQNNFPISQKGKIKYRIWPCYVRLGVSDCSVCGRTTRVQTKTRHAVVPAIFPHVQSYIHKAFHRGAIIFKHRKNICLIAKLLNNQKYVSFLQEDLRISQRIFNKEGFIYL